jgi:hypothetical protein
MGKNKEKQYLRPFWRAAHSDQILFKGGKNVFLICQNDWKLRWHYEEKYLE